MPFIGIAPCLTFACSCTDLQGLENSQTATINSSLAQNGTSMYELFFNVNPYETENTV